MTDMTFLEQIRQAEQQVADMIEKAQQEADALQEKTRLETAEYLEQIRQDVRVLAEAQATADEQAAGEIRESARASSQADADRIRASVSDRMVPAVGAAAERIVNLSVNR